MVGRAHTSLTWTTLLQIVAVLVLSWCSFPSFAVQPANGYFTGVDLQPIGSASVATVETEPAVALVFAVDQKTAETTRQFDEWFKSADRPNINVFAIGVDPANLSDDIVLEAINQRNLSMPVFLASADMLLGDDFRLVVLDGDRVVERLSTPDFGVLNAAIGRLGIDIPAPAATSPIATPPAAEPSPAVAIEDVPEAGAPVSDDAVITTTTTTVSEAPAQSRVAGGASTDNSYVNTNYGFSAEFPPGWKYQIAAREDGAIAIEPDGSQMDMRVWAVPVDEVKTPQGYIDQRLESLARKNATRVNVERRFEVREDGKAGVDITYNYARPIDPDVPSRGLLLYRGRIQVFVDGGYIKAAGVEAPGGEFTAMYPMIESFFRNFEVQDAGYSSPML